jgi:hypothetical protein
VNPSSGSAAGAVALPFDLERDLEEERPFPVDGNSREPVFTPGIDIIGGAAPELTLKVFTLEFFGGGGIAVPPGGGGGTYWACFCGLLSLTPDELASLFLLLKSPHFFFSFFSGASVDVGSFTYSGCSYLAGADPYCTLGISKGGGHGPEDTLNDLTFAFDGGGGISAPPAGGGGTYPLLLLDLGFGSGFDFLSGFGFSSFCSLVYFSLGFDDSDQNTFTFLIASSPSFLYSTGGRPFIVLASLSFFVVI